MNNHQNYSRRQFLQKAGIGLGAVTLLCGAGGALALARPKIEWIEKNLKGNTEMDKSILVAYGSKCGSTSQVADAIGKTLNEQGAHVEVKPVDAVTSLAGIRAVVIGSAIRYGAVLPTVADFIRENSAALNNMPVAYFTVGSTLFSDTPENRAAVAAYTAPQKALVSPAACADFAGVFDPAKVSFVERLLGKAMKMPEGDFRDWDAITAWATGLAPMMLG